MSTTQSAISPRIFRVHGSCYERDEVSDARHVYTDEAIASVAEMGYDGVWMHAQLRQLIPTSLFSSYEHDAPSRLDSLHHVVHQARRHGVGVWLYLNEPRTYPSDHPFWKDHPECQGHEFQQRWNLGWQWPIRQRSHAMCVMTEPVTAFITESIRQLFSALPELAGIITITNSEHPTHCYSKVPLKYSTNCPRCKDVARVEMPTRILHAMYQGLRQSGSPAKLAAWTWSWNALAPDPQPSLIQALPKDLSIVSDFERGEKVKLLDQDVLIDEYAFSVTGPSQRFLEYLKETRSAGLPIWAKLQVSATHELATAPNIPALVTLYDKIKALRDCGGSGAMATWTMGLRVTLNSFAAGRLLAHEGQLPSRDTFLAQLARDYFDPSFSEKETNDLIAAWYAFSEAMRFFPTTMPMCYWGIMNYAPAFPWKLKREGTPLARTWEAEPWGDKLEMTTSPFSLAQIAEIFRRISSLWAQGMLAYERALQPWRGRLVRAEQEYNAAEMVLVFYRSTGNAYAFADAVDQSAPRAILEELIDNELSNCGRAIPLLERDERIGFHDDCGLMLTPYNVKQKIKGLHLLKEQLAS